MVYIEPRTQFDSALKIDESQIIYILSKIIDLLMACGMSYHEAMDYYCFNIECIPGLTVEDDLSEEYIEEDSYGC